MSFTPTPIPLSSAPTTISEVMNINFQLLADCINQLENKLLEVNNLAKKKTSDSPTFTNVTVTCNLTVQGKDMMKWAVLQG